VFVEDDTERDGDDNNLLAQNQRGACWEDVSVVNGLPMGSSRNTSFGPDISVLAALIGTISVINSSELSLPI
jgi:hypothetical protein